jgi:hypothetical protein
MNKKLKYGDTRKDGYRFGGSSTVTNKSGEKKKIEKWYSPTSFLKLVKASRTATNRLRRENPEKYRKQARDYKEANKEKYRSGRLKREFGISIEDYNKKLKRQGDGCAICKKKCASGNHLSVDHCHSSGFIRGLLCNKCNLGLGLFKDDIILLVEAKKYLVKHKKLSCIKQKKSASRSQAKSGR